MRCKKCGGNGKVYVSRNKKNGSVYRRRVCEQCQNSWTTIELNTEYLKAIITGLSRITNNLKHR